MIARGDGWRSAETLEWLIAEGRFAPDFDALIDAVGRRCLADGAPVWRLRVGFRTLNPLVTAVTSIWERDGTEVRHFEAQHGLETRASYIGSPLQRVARDPEPFRRRLEDGLTEDDHAVLHDLRARGGTDYYGRRLKFSTNGAGVFVVTCDAPGGFSSEDIAKFDALADALAPLVEIERLKQVSSAVAAAYLGPRSAEAVLGGRITRGDVETIDAAILVSDLRDWTGLSERLSPTGAIDFANRYFDIVADAVEASGGEILKFVGDGVLAIFPEENSESPAPERALAAARRALAEAEAAGVEMGIGLHVGEVLFGNVGSATRLDFTVLGSAVNIAARIEGLCAAMGRRLLYSGAFAARLGNPGPRIAEAALKGVAAKTEVHGER